MKKVNFSNQNLLKKKLIKIIINIYKQNITNKNNNFISIITLNKKNSYIRMNLYKKVITIY